MRILDRKISRRHFGLLCTFGIAAVSAGAVSVPSFGGSAIVDLLSAKTIQVQETVLVRDKSGQLVPGYESIIRIERPDKVNVLITAAALKTPHQYVQDGKNEREYDAKGNTVRTLTLPKSGRSYSSLRRTAYVDLILGGGQLPPSKPNYQRTVTQETVNGVAMTVTTVTAPEVINPRGTAFIASEKLWTVTATNLPARYTNAYTSEGKTTVSEDVSFSNWRLDEPLTASQLAFAPPAGAKAYVEPQMPQMTTLPVGATAPDFAAVTPDGKMVHLSDYKGKVVILDFWATWCHPCQDAMPHLQSVYEQVKGQNVAVLALCVWDAKNAYDKWVKEKTGTFTFPTAFDPAGQDNAKSIAGKLYNMNAIPTQYVIGRDGKIVAAFVGDEGQRLEKALEAQGVTVSTEPKVAVPKP